MYVYMLVCILVCILGCIFVCILVCMHVCVLFIICAACRYVFDICIFVCVYVYKHKPTLISLCMLVCMHTTVCVYNVCVSFLHTQHVSMCYLCMPFLCQYMHNACIHASTHICISTHTKMHMCNPYMHTFINS